MSDHHTLEPTIEDSELIYHKLIQRGSFGDVYRVTWQSKNLGDVDSAAKKIHIPENLQDISEDLENEIHFLKTLKHPSIIEFYGLAITSDHVVLVTEFATEGSLFDYLKKKTELPRDLKTKWAIQTAHGLKYLRDKNVLHRDIKSPNLLITADYDIKICDFGISKNLTSTKTTKHYDKGSLKWQAPEIFKDGQLSPKADIFAFGIVLWEMETCKEPYNGQMACHVMYKVGTENARPTIPDFCPSILADLIQQCWHGDKDCRPNIEEVIEQLIQLQEKKDHSEDHSLQTHCATSELNDKKPASNTIKEGKNDSTSVTSLDLRHSHSLTFDIFKGTDQTNLQRSRCESRISYASSRSTGTQTPSMIKGDSYDDDAIFFFDESSYARSGSVFDYHHRSSIDLTPPSPNFSESLFSKLNEMQQRENRSNSEIAIPSDNRSHNAKKSKDKSQGCKCVIC